MISLAPLLACLIAGAPEAPPARVVVVVGYNGGAPDPRPPLSFADDDAARLFLQLAGGARRAWLLTTFDKESARAFPDLADIARAPTKEALAGALGEAFWFLRQEKDRGEKTELVFAFAGHGDVDDGGQGFVVFADGAFTRGDLARQVLLPSPADLNHVVVDACSSYFFVKSRGSEAEAVPLTPALFDALKDPLPQELVARTGLLVSTSQAVEVHESRALSAGVFSYLLRSALAGGGDVDGDGRVEYGEAAVFVGAASQAVEDPRARLHVFAEPPLQRPHAALVDLRGQADEPALSFLAVDEPGRVRLLDARGVPWAEVNNDVNSGKKRPVYLSLAGQPFFVVQKDGAEAVLVPRSGGAYALSSLDFSPAPTARGDGGGPFARLFERPLDDGFVRGFFASGASIEPVGGSEPFAPAWSLAGTPPQRVPVGLIGGAVLGGAAVAGVAAGGAIVGNQLAFQELERGFGQTGQLDPARVLEVDGWRNAATALTATAVVLGIAGGALVLWSLSLEDGEVALP
ncbi:MAG: hypothetical protein Q8O67_15575 [Deltaproteobacteria bacterium]|nr:hypothetical protein [Deltaproteobacteria bacterium]